MNINNILNKKNIEHIKKYALENINIESCGLILQNQKEIFIYPSINISLEKDKFFTINPKDYLKASLLGNIIGIYHSHTENGSLDFSQTDIKNAKNHGLIYVLYCIKTNSFKIYDGSQESIYKDYLNIPFEIGKNDCYELIKNYYKNELKINLPNLSRDKNWYENNNQRFLLEFQSQFHKFLKETNILQKNAILLFKYKHKEYPHHLGVYLDNNEFLHHPQNKFSTINIYDKIYQKCTSKILIPKYENIN